MKQPNPLQRTVSSFLEEPVMTKVTERGEAKVSSGVCSMGRESNDGDSCSKLRYAVSEMQGWRSHMEDNHVLNPQLASDRQQAVLLKDHHLFAVFDGHGGDFASKFCGGQLVSALITQTEWQEYLALSSVKTRDSVKGLTLLKSALTSTFLQLDNKLMEAQTKIRINQLNKLESLVHSLHLSGTFEHDIFQKGTQEHERVMSFDRQLPSTLPSGITLERSGSTGVVVLITPSHIICANAGDSRAILSKTTAANVLPLSFDHKPSKDVEMARVERDGGFVRAGRVDGDLAVSRSFGDFGFKYGSRTKDHTSSKPKDHRVTVYPDIVVYARESSKDEFLVLACDGIWDRLSNKDCSDLVHSLIYREGETDVGLICEEVIDTALELDSRDNMTCCIVLFPSINLDTLSVGSTMGVTERRLSRERAWGENSTPLMRQQQRIEERRMRHQELRSSGVEQQKSKSSSKSQLHKASSKKHKASSTTKPKASLSSNDKLRSINIGRTSSSSSRSSKNIQLNQSNS